MESITRTIAVGLPVKDGCVLVSEGEDRRTGRQFFRALGGGVETGESPAQALHREFYEELGVRLNQVDRLDIAVDHFEFEGAQWQETAHIFAVQSADISAIPVDATLRVRDNGDLVHWVPLELVESGDKPLYPAPSIRLLRTHARTS